MLPNVAVNILPQWATDAVNILAVTMQVQLREGMRKQLKWANKWHSLGHTQ